MEFINSEDDMQWLKDVHLPKLDKKFKSAILQGFDESTPDKIFVYETVVPTIDSSYVSYQYSEDKDCYEVCQSWEVKI